MKIKNVIFSAALLLFLLIVLGGVVQAAGPTYACAGWPLCDGLLVPSLAAPVWFDYLHRVLSMVVLLILSFLAFRLRHQLPSHVRSALIFSFVILVAQALFGVLLVFRPIPWISGIHLAFSLLALAALIHAWIIVGNGEDENTRTFQLNTRYQRVVFGTALVIFAVLVSGGLIAGADPGVVCPGWPLCNGWPFPGHPLGWLHLFHRVLVGFGALAVFVVMLRAWRIHREQTGVLVSATLVGMLYLAQIQLGALQVFRAFPTDLLWLHQAASVALWAACVALVTFVGYSGHTQAEEDAQKVVVINVGQRVKDLVALSKPIIVLLLLVTTYTGMVVGGKSIPGFEVTLFTLVGGALAAGGSGAINQYIDRDIDRRMARTAKRPIAAGRMFPSEGIAFGVGVLVVAFFLLAGFVNLLAALLSLAGMLYYVVLYSLILKHRSVQNIVIGGGAGAIPPLVGWAAVTGSLSMPALFLFAIIFMWTPPHFWALALIRKNDYKEAGIPMLPVVKGEQETRRQVWIYTLELVGLTLLMWLFQMAGWIYLVAALLLGGYLIYWAWQVLKVGTNQIAWRMYRYSSMYLALLFVALMIDAVMLP